MTVNADPLDTVNYKSEAEFAIRRAKCNTDDDVLRAVRTLAT
jgi:hypothetical protein